MKSRQRSARQRTSAARPALRLEPLEGRMLLTTFVHADASSGEIRFVDGLTGSVIPGSTFTPVGNYKCTRPGPVEIANPINCDALELGDVDGDGQQEIIHGDQGSNQIVIYEQGSATPVAVFPEYTCFSPPGDPAGTNSTCDRLAVGDLDGDGREEIIRAATNRGGRIEVFDANGTLRAFFLQDNTGAAVGFHSWDGLAVGDVDGNGRDEIIHGDASANTIRVHDGTGAFSDSFGTYSDFDRLTTGDVDFDANQDDEIIQAVDSTHEIIIYDGRNSILNSFSTNNNGSYACRFGDRLLCDGLAVNDGTILLGDDLGKTVNVFARNGRVLNRFRQGIDFESKDKLAVLPLVDSDGDRLFDVWEINGIDTDFDGSIDVDLPAMGADPLHKDLFLEFDWMRGAPPERREIQLLKTAFAMAPVDAGGIPNPDGLPGINLWIDTGSLVDPTASEDGAAAGSCSDGINNGSDAGMDGSDPDCLVGDDLGGGNEVPASLIASMSSDDDSSGCAAFYEIKNDVQAPSCTVVGPNAQFTPSRRGIFRYGLSAQWGPGISAGGWGEIGGNDFIEYLHDAGTIMHELGHTLGLGHGGDGHHNCKPNYLSVMNYQHQFGIRQTAGGTIIDFSPPRHANGRSVGALPELKEDDLDEPLILDANDPSNMLTFVNKLGNRQNAALDGPINWNGDADSTDVGVMANIDNDTRFAACRNATEDSELEGHDDWTAISLGFRNFGDFADGPLNPETDPSPTLVDRPNEIHGVKFDDRNGNGTRDPGEPGLSGWTIFLSGTDINGNTVVDQTVTDGEGRYWFSFLSPGTYTLEEELQEGWRQSAPPQLAYFLDLSPGERYFAADFGNYRPASIHGFKWEDLNADGQQDLGEDLLPEWRVRLAGVEDAGNRVEREVVTMEDGHFWIEDVKSGTYTLTEIIPAPGSVVARAVGSQVVSTPIPGPQTIANGDFSVTGFDGNPVGDGADERTDWTFDFTTDAGFQGFDPRGGLASAEMVLTLTAAGPGSNNDTLIVGGQSIAPIEIQNTPFSMPGSVKFDLLDHISSDELLDAVAAAAGRLSIAHIDDALISYAELRLTPVGRATWDQTHPPGGGYPLVIREGRIQNTDVFDAWNFGNRRAQNPTLIDLGRLKGGSTSSIDDLAAEEILLYRIDVPSDVVAANGGFLVIDTNGSALADTGTGPNDTEIALYDVTGMRIDQNDDGTPPMRESLLAFGDHPNANSDLTAGVYYLAVGAFDSTFNETRFNVRSASTSTGTVQTNIAYSSPIELGPLAQGNQSTNSALAAGEIVEFRIELQTDVVAAAGRSITFDTDGSVLTDIGNGPNDTEIAIYDVTGMRIDQNDDGMPPMRESLLAFGDHPSATRDLAAGVYYLAVGAFDSTFTETRFGLGSISQSIGNVQVNIDIQPAGLSADFDRDGDVDGADYPLWWANFGLAMGASMTQGDASGDGDVDGNDFLAWQEQFGSRMGGAGAADQHTFNPKRGIVVDAVFEELTSARNTARQLLKLNHRLSKGIADELFPLSSLRKSGRH